MTERIEILLERAARLDEAAPSSRRREDLVARAVEAGHSREYADQIYDVAEEESLDPAVAFEVVLCGVGVRELAAPTADAWNETQVEAPPAWLADPLPPPDEAARERRIRSSFRRLRAIMGGTPSPQEALRAFVLAPDVGDVDY
jgi:hypothetical protein